MVPFKAQCIVVFPKIKYWSYIVNKCNCYNDINLLSLINFFSGDWYECVWTKTINYSSNRKIIKILKSSDIRFSIQKKEGGGGGFLELDGNIKCTRWYNSFNGVQNQFPIYLLIYITHIVAWIQHCLAVSTHVYKSINQLIFKISCQIEIHKVSILPPHKFLFLEKILVFLRRI